MSTAPTVSTYSMWSLFRNCRKAVDWRYLQQLVPLSRDRNPEAAVTVSLGGPAGNIYVNPYTGAILGTGSARANQFFQTLTTWHRYMGATGDARSLGKSATGASNP